MYNLLELLVWGKESRVFRRWKRSALLERRQRRELRELSWLLWSGLFKEDM